MAGLLDLFSGNASPEATNSLLGFAQGLLQASGPSSLPQGFGQVLGGGIQGLQRAQSMNQDRSQEAQLAALRDLQIKSGTADLQSQEQANQQQQAIQQAAQAALSPDGQFDQSKFLEGVRRINALKALDLEKQFAKQGPEYDTTPQVVNGPDGRPVLVQLSKTAAPRVLEGLSPREKAELINLGGSSVAVNPFDVKPGQSFQRTASPDTLANNAVAIRGQNMTDSRTREANSLKYEELGIKRQEKQREADLGKAGQIASFDTMLGTLDRLKDHPGLARSTGLYSKVPTLPGSDSANFQSELETFKSQAFIPAVAQLKGMGALSDAEGKKLSAAVGALDPRMSESAFKESLNRVITEMNAARSRVVASASPEVRQSLGANTATVPQQTTAPRVPMKGQVVQGYRFKGGNPADPNAWEKQ